MSSIVLDLQQEVLKPDCDVLNSLRKAHLIATKLKLQEFDNWIKSELNGYPEDDQEAIPKYRSVKGQLKAWNPYHGWIPVDIPDSNIETVLCKKNLGNSISEILELYRKSEGHILLYYTGDMEQTLNKICSAPFSTSYALHVSTHLLKAIIDQVQNCLLEWTIRLENEGVLGENLQFSPEEASMAKNVPQTINNYYGPVVHGNIKQSQVVSGNHNSFAFDYKQVADLIRQVKEKIQDEQLSEEDREVANELIAESESKIAAQTRPGIIKASLSGLKDFLIGAGANVAGAVIVQYLQYGI